MEGRPFVLLGVNTDEDRTDAQKAIQKQHLNWRSWWVGATDGPLVQAWNVRSFPSFFLIDHHGTIRSANLNGKDLDGAVEKLVVEAENEKGS